MVFLLERGDIQAGEFHEQAVKLIDLLFSALESPPERKPTALLHEHVQREKFRFAAGTQGQAYFWVLVGQLIAWVVAGWLLARFVFPGHL